MRMMRRRIMMRIKMTTMMMSMRTLVELLSVERTMKDQRSWEKGWEEIGLEMPPQKTTY
jgi:hypothetical protein